VGASDCGEAGPRCAGSRFSLPTPRLVEGIRSADCPRRLAGPMLITRAGRQTCPGSGVRLRNSLPPRTAGRLLIASGPCRIPFAQLLSHRAAPSP
jgi:hypothetical protein